MVFLCGIGLHFYRQTRFVAPRFPEAHVIHSADTEMISLVSGGSIDKKDAVTIRVSGAVNDKGIIKLAIYSSSEGFNDPPNAMVRVTQPVELGEANFVFKRSDLPKKFAIAAFHDENGDEELSTNPLGIPTERYGFSNNARGTLGPPTYEEALIALPKDESLTIYIR